MPGIRACPFCEKGYPEVRCSDYPTGMTQEYWVECSECDARGPHADDKKNAIKRWNSRYEEVYE